MIQLGGRQLECGKDPYIICAVDNNWHKPEDILHSIDQAKIVGADAVKFLMYDYESLYGVPKDKKTSYSEAHELQEDFLGNIKSQCDRVGIDLLVSIYNPDAVRLVDSFVNAHHITSSELNHVPLLKELCRSRKPVFMHVAGATETEIRYALSILEATPVILMYGVESRPDAASYVDLTLIDQLKKLDSHVGFFDLTTDPIYIPYSAVKHHQVCTIEKHLNAVQGVTPDYKFSLSPADFKTMVERLHGKSRGLFKTHKLEHNLLRKHKRRLVSTSVIRAGEVLRFGKNYGMFSVLKSEQEGLFAADYLDIDGKKTILDIELGNVITGRDIEGY